MKSSTNNKLLSHIKSLKFLPPINSLDKSVKSIAFGWLSLGLKSLSTALIATNQYDNARFHIDCKTERNFSTPTDYARFRCQLANSKRCIHHLMNGRKVLNICCLILHLLLIIITILLAPIYGQTVVTNRTGFVGHNNRSSEPEMSSCHNSQHHHHHHHHGLRLNEHMNNYRSASSHQQQFEPRIARGQSRNVDGHYYKPQNHYIRQQRQPEALVTPIAASGYRVTKDNKREQHLTTVQRTQAAQTITSGRHHNNHQLSASIDDSWRSPAVLVSHDNNKPARPATVCAHCLAVVPVRSVPISDTEELVVPTLATFKTERKSILPYYHPDDDSAAILPSARQPPLNGDRYNYGPPSDDDDEYNYKQAELLRPRSDDKCSLTGPLTICDQIGSYPVNIVLRKLDTAKRALKKSAFNLDSLFSDEREHLSDPFDDELAKRDQNRGFSQSSSSSSSSSMNVSRTVDGRRTLGADHYSLRQQQQQTSYANYGANADYERGPDARLRDDDDDDDAHRIYLLSHKNSERSRKYGHRVGDENEPSVQRAARKSYEHDTDNADEHPANNNNNNNIRHQNGAINAANVVADEFVELVERQAISIGASRSLEPKQADGAEIDAADRVLSYHDRRSAGSEAGARAGAVQRRPTDSKLPTSGKALAESLLSVALSQYGGGGGGAKKRSRRQVASVRVSADSGSGSSGGGQQQQQQPPATMVANLDPERISDAANLVAPEPVCRARSIYISPKAALNDKRQWKYVVNAPERDPQVRQIIRVDICEDPLGPCSSQLSLPFGFTSQCKQKYAKKKLLALDAQSGSLEVDTFFIPSCCVCQLVRDQTLDSSDSDQDSNQNDTAEPSSGDSRAAAAADASLSENDNGFGQPTSSDQISPAESRLDGPSLGSANFTMGSGGGFGNR